MTDNSGETDPASAGAEDTPSPLAAGASLIRNGWRSLKTVYYANSLSWRFLKSGALVFLGFFLWVGANLLYSYNPELGVLRYPMAYGFLLIGYGPIHHLVVIPLALRWRRRDGARSRIGRRLPTAMLAVFLVAVVVLGTAPVGAMTVDFQGALESSGADVSPDLLCTKSTTDDGAEVHCHLSTSEGIDRVVVRSGDATVATDDSPPFEFTVHERNLVAVTGETQFTVVLQDENGEMIRRYTRRLSMVDEG